MFDTIKGFYKTLPKDVLGMTMVSLIFVARKTLFNVSRSVGDYSASIDSGTSLALVGIVLSFIILSRNTKGLKMVHRCLFVFLLYSYFAFLSILWARAGNSFAIVFKSVEVLVNIYLHGIIIYRIKKYKSQVLYIIVYSTIVTYMDAFFDGRGWFAFHHANGYPVSAMIGALVSLAAVHMRMFHFSELSLFIILNIIACLGGTSTATNISLLMGFIILYSSDKKGFKWQRIFVMGILVYVVYYLFERNIYSFVTRGHSEDSISNMTGRTLIWEAALKSWQENPWIGKGFVVGERSLAAYGLGHEVLSAHNSYISILVNTGIIGTLLFVNFIIRWIHRLLIKGRYFPYASLIVPTAIAILINIASAPVIGSDQTHVSSCCYLLIAFSFMNFRDIKPWRGKDIIA